MDEQLALASNIKVSVFPCLFQKAEQNNLKKEKKNYTMFLVWISYFNLCLNYTVLYLAVK